MAGISKVAPVITEATVYGVSEGYSNDSVDIMSCGNNLVKEEKT